MNNLSLNLNTIINEYNYNQRLYNENISRMINLIENSHSPRPHPSTNRYFMGTPVRRPRTLQEQIMFFLNSTAAAATVGEHNNTIRPTPQQIQNATENMLYSTDTEVNHTVCPISLEAFQNNEPITRIRRCGHIFRRECLQQWFSNHTVCPVCRYNILNSDAPPEEAEPAQTNETRAGTENILSRLLQNLLDLSGTDIDYEYTSTGNNGNLLYEFTIPLYRSSGGGGGGGGSRERSTQEIDLQEDNIEDNDFDDDADADAITIGNISVD